MKKQQIPNHQLHRISHKTSLSLNNSHKTNPLLNSSHKACPPLKNNHKVKQTLILNRNLSHHNSAMMMTHFQIMAQLSKLLQRKIPALYQRSQNTAQNHHNTHLISFNCLVFSLFRVCKEKQDTLGQIKYFNLVPTCQNFIFF